LSEEKNQLDAVSMASVKFIPSSSCRERRRQSTRRLSPEERLHPLVLERERRSACI
jgi:hypothetical protein